jgi:hypothetical protein
MYDMNVGLNLSLVYWNENITESIDGVRRTKNMNNEGFTMKPWLRYLFKINSLFLSPFQPLLDWSTSVFLVAVVLRLSYIMNTTIKGIMQNIAVI